MLRAKSIFICLRTKCTTLKILVASLVLLGLGLQQVAAQAPTKAADLIAMKAHEFSLGNPRPESPAPRQTPPPRNHGWWQAFERGWVYWTPAHGAHVVRGRVFEVWGREGWENGTLGFPTHDEEVCQAPDIRDNFQRFEGGVIHWRAATNEAIIHYNDAQNNLTFAVSGVCMRTATAVNTATTAPPGTNRVENTSVPAQGPPSTSPPPDKKTDRLVRSSGLFRITIDNFIAVKVAHNGLLDAGDDAFLMWDAQEFNADGRLVGGPLAGRSLIYGSMGRNRAHIQAGTQGDNGGIRAGDKISGRSAPSANRLPMLVGDFLLVDRENAFIFAPTVWVAENDAGNFAYQYRQRFQLRTRFVAHDVRRQLELPDDFPWFHWRSSNSRTPDDWMEIHYSRGMNNIRGDRPIGAWQEWDPLKLFLPHSFLLTYKTVTDFMQSAGGHRQVPFEARYGDSGGGAYIISMTIERVK